MAMAGLHKLAVHDKIADEEVGRAFCTCVLSQQAKKPIVVVAAAGTTALDHTPTGDCVARAG